MNLLKIPTFNIINWTNSSFDTLYNLINAFFKKIYYRGEQYYVGGKLHRKDGPAVIGQDGRLEYYQDGQLHRENGPAIINGTRKEYYQYGKLHRENGPAVQIFSFYKEYWMNGQLHREDGPAIMHHDGTKIYYIHGKKHRLEGPAIIGPKEKGEWFISNINITDEVNEWLLLTGYKVPLNKQQQAEFKLRFLFNEL